MIRVNVYNYNIVEMIKNPTIDFVILPTGYVLTNQKELDEQLEDVFYQLNWSNWTKEKPKEVHSTIDSCGSGVILNIDGSKEFYLSMSVGWKKFDTFRDLYEWVKRNWKDPVAMFKDLGEITFDIKE